MEHCGSLSSSRPTGHLTSQKLTPQSHSTPKQSVVVQDRKSLQTLQHSATGKGRLNGGKHSKPVEEPKTLGENDPPYTNSPRGMEIYEDPQPTCVGVHCSRDTQTEDALLEDLLQQKLDQGVSCEDSGILSASQDTLDLVVNENPSENYWKNLAEERRRALKETLVENERLTCEVDRLTAENGRLKQVEERAHQLEKLLEDILPDDEEVQSEVTTPTTTDDVGEALPVTESQCGKS